MITSPGSPFMPRNALPNVILPILALAGTGLAVVTVFAGTRAPQSPVVVDQPAQSAFAYAVSGTGLVEPGSEFIEVGTCLLYTSDAADE